jgi:hypothetical protein
MQAPTTPSGAPAKEPAERACQGCGAANAPGAVFCWQCYRPFSGQAASSGAAMRSPDVAGPPAAWTGGVTAPVRSSRLGTLVAVGVVALAAIGGVLFLVGRGGEVTLPDTLNGMDRIVDPQTELVVGTFRAQAETGGIEGDMALYGKGVPTAALLWIRDATVPTTDAAFDEFAAGFNEGIGSQGSLGAKQTELLGGVTFVCAPVRSVAPGTICMWQDEDLFWLVFDFSGSSFDQGQALAVAAHDAVSS